MNEANKAFYESMLEMNEMLHSVGRIDAKKYEQIKDKYTAVLSAQSMTGEQFAKIRHHLKLSQAALAKTLGASVSAICKWERNDRQINPQAAILMTVLNKHGMSVLQ